MRQYINSPLIEAIWEVRFSEEINWNLGLIESFKNTIKESFPHETTEKFTKCEGVDDDAGGVKFQVEELTVYSSENKKIDILIGKQSLFVRAMKPYPSWIKIINTIKLVITELLLPSEYNGKIFARLEYNNLINTESKIFDINTFNIKLQIPECISYPTNDFYLGSEFLIKEKKALCRLVIRRAFPDRTNPTVSYTFNISCRTKGPIDKSEIFSWVDKSHDIVEELFECCITDNMRSKFSGEKE